MTESAQAELHFFMTSSSSSTQSSSSPSCLKWARNLSCLLEDRDGVEQFKKYVEQEGGIHSDRLNFYFACEGLKQQSDPDKVRQIIGAIYRFLKKSQLHIPDDIRQTIKTGLKDKLFILTPDLFDQMQQDVEKIINDTTYPNFLQSEMYVNYVQNYQSAIDQRSLPPTTNTTTATSSSTSESNSKYLSRSSTLPTLHEEGGDGGNLDGSESFGCAVGGYSDSSNRVPTLSASSSSKVPMSLTKDALMATQRRRLEMRPPG
jgi:axin 1